MRKFMVVLDDSRECLNAMRFAAMRASNSGGGVVVLSVIDNLTKGASGQAVQNMNILFGLDERAGLAQPALMP